MAEIYLKVTDLAKRYGVHKMTPYRWLKTEPTFPKPIQLTTGCTRWRLSEVEAWETKKSARAK